MTLDQLALVRLLQLQHDYIEEWRELFQGAMIRARSHRGRTVTVTLYDLESLITAGFLSPGYGGSFILTEAGRAI